jgi:hypothetical protein
MQVLESHIQKQMEGECSLQEFRNEGATPPQYDINSRGETVNLRGITISITSTLKA